MEENKNENENGPQKASPGGLAVAGAFILDLAKIILITAVIVFPFRHFVADPFVVSGTSMLPNFHDNDYLVIDRLSYRSQEPGRGDVVVLRYPRDLTQYFIKRIIGLPGESIQIQQGFVTIYNQQHPEGFRLQEPYLTNQNSTVGHVDKLTLGSDEYYVLGDNRTGSSDSRAWGILPREDIVGRVWVRVLPVSRFGKIENPTYSDTIEQK